MKKITHDKVNLIGWIYIPEDHNEAILTFHGVEWALAVYDIDQEVRNRQKYGPEFKNAGEALEWVRETIHDILSARNISLDMII